MEEDSQTIDGLRNMEWWDGMEWDTLKRHTGVTMGAVPRSLKHAVAQWRVKVCRHINEADNEEAQTRGWKLLFAMDLLMFGDLRENAGDRTKSNMITDRMEYMEKGQWGSVWTLVGYRRQSDTDQRRGMRRRQIERKPCWKPKKSPGLQRQCGEVNKDEASKR